MSEPAPRGNGQSRVLVRTAAACITASLAVLIGISVTGPSIAEPTMNHPPFGPPWWVSLSLPASLVLFGGWAAVIVGTVGVAAGLAAVARGWRPRARPLVVASLIVTAVFAVLPPAGSSDTQSYAIDGSIVVMGHSPYVDTPAQMAALGDKLAANGPATWQKSLSDYGPLATGEEWLSAELGGPWLAHIAFWLKLWISLAFAGVALLLDRLLRGDPAMRLRAHLLWSLNPLVLWEIVAVGHIDGLAAGLGLCGLVVPRFRDRVPPSLARCLASGALLGCAAAIKSPFLLFLAGALWAVRRSPAAIAATVAGWVAVVVPMYAAAGSPAISVLFDRGGQVTWDNLYQIFYRAYGFARFGSAVAPGYVVPVAMALCVAVAVLAFLRLPDGTRREDGVSSLPAVTPALALSLAWIFFWPYQRPWYDVMVIVLLVLYPRSRLDALVLVRLCFAAVTYVESAHLPQRGWLQHTQLFQGEWITSSVRLLTGVALIWLCVTARWRSGVASSSAADSRVADNSMAGTSMAGNSMAGNSMAGNSMADNSATSGGVTERATDEPVVGPGSAEPALPGPQV